MEYYLATKKNEIRPLPAKWMDYRLSSWEGKSDGEGEILYDFPYMWNLQRNDANELTKQKETQREWTYGSRCGVEGGKR